MKRLWKVNSSKSKMWGKDCAACCLCCALGWLPPITIQPHSNHTRRGGWVHVVPRFHPSRSAVEWGLLCLLRIFVDGERYARWRHCVMMRLQDSPVCVATGLRTSYQTTMKRYYHIAFWEMIQGFQSFNPAKGLKGETSQPLLLRPRWLFNFFTFRFTFN